MPTPKTPIPPAPATTDADPYYNLAHFSPATNLQGERISVMPTGETRKNKTPAAPPVPFSLAMLDGDSGLFGECTDSLHVPERFERTPGDQLRFEARIWSGAMVLQALIGFPLSGWVLHATWDEHGDGGLKGAVFAFVVVVFTCLGMFFCDGRARRLQRSARGIR